jgi:uncharacterized protein involved in response to NO
MRRALFAAPYRVFFLAAAAQLLVAGAWWAGTLSARAAGIALPLGSGVAPIFAHALLMTYGFFPLFIFGFVHTVGPRWLGRPLPTPRQYAPAALAAAAGSVLLLPALHWSATAAATAILPMLAAWGWMLGSHFAMLRASRVEDRLHARIIGFALAFGVAGLAAARHALLTGSHRSEELAEAFGLWGLLVPVFITVCHRMIPCAGANALPRGADLKLLAGASMLHAVIAGVGFGPWTWIVDLPAGAWMVHLAWRWHVGSPRGKRLLTMLVTGFAWLAAGWCLQGVQSALQLADVRALGLAPIHAVAIGALSSITLAMVARLTASSSGRRAGDDQLTWTAFCLVQSAAVARVGADLLPSIYAFLLVVAILTWLAGFAGWSWRYMPQYWRAHNDGMPG